MTALDDLRATILLACEIQDRSNAEQRSLLGVAARADQQANRLTVTNRRSGPAWRLYRFVENSRVLVDDQREVLLPAKDRDRLDRQADRWDRHAGERNLYR